LRLSPLRGISSPRLARAALRPQRFILSTVESVTGPLPDAGLHGLQPSEAAWRKKVRRAR
jgi:hypothetical protein